jgi:hypothetical protein
MDSYIGFNATGNGHKPFEEEYAMSQDMILRFTVEEMDIQTDLITAVMFLEFAE